MARSVGYGESNQVWLCPFCDMRWVVLLENAYTACQAQARQHEADLHDGVFKLLETHLGDQPRLLPTIQSLLGLTRLSPPTRIPAS